MIQNIEARSQELVMKNERGGRALLNSTSPSTGLQVPILPLRRVRSTGHLEAAPVVEQARDDPAHRLLAALIEVDSSSDHAVLQQPVDDRRAVLGRHADDLRLRQLRVQPLHELDRFVEEQAVARLHERDHRLIRPTHAMREAVERVTDVADPDAQTGQIAGERPRSNTSHLQDPCRVDADHRHPPPGPSQEYGQAILPELFGSCVLHV